MTTESEIELRYQLRKTMSALMPLRGKAAADELNRVLAPVRARAAADGLTEEKLNALLNEKL
jgi:hypothetical protein